MVNVTYNMNQSGWFCPSCQKYHSPYVQTCPGSNYPNPWTAPEIPHYPNPWNPPNDWGTNHQCTKCGLVLQNVMGYVCPDNNCPTFGKVT